MNIIKRLTRNQGGRPPKYGEKLVDKYIGVPVSLVKFIKREYPNVVFAEIIIGAVTGAMRPLGYTPHPNSKLAKDAPRGSGELSSLYKRRNT